MSWGQNATTHIMTSTCDIIPKSQPGRQRSFPSSSSTANNPGSKYLRTNHEAVVLLPTMSAPESYAAIKHQLLSRPGPVLPPPPSNPSQTISHAIASLSLHPSLEVTLHLLNDDLPSAHFLVRKMQAPPRYEAMMLHGVLHRIEGDYDNARIWYRDVKDSEVFKSVWGKDGLDSVLDFVRRIEILRKESKTKDAKDVEELEKESMREIKGILEFCEKEFGTEKVVDASAIWCQDEKSSAKGNDMVVGGEGWRQF